MNEINVMDWAFASIRIRYEELSKKVKQLKIRKKDALTVFVNVESVFMFLCMSGKDEIIKTSEDEAKMESLFIDIAAHYRYFFRQLVDDVKVVMYYTDPTSDSFPQEDIFPEYRSQYLHRFSGNDTESTPLAFLLKTDIISHVKTICDFIPNVYCICEKNIDGAEIPLILKEAGRKNLIITADLFETQYRFVPDYMVIYKTKRNGLQYLATSLNELETCIFGGDIDKKDLELLENKSFYRMLISSRGNGIRSIPHLNGIGAKTALKNIKGGIEKGIVTKDTRNIELLSKCYPKTERGDMIRNFAVFDFVTFKNHLGNGSIAKVKENVIDRSDVNALIRLNETRYQNRPFWINGLL